ncbi:MAG TPA: hypothetical protein VHR42_00695 [Clostridia bacterium]|nr:hypothetical protein [Clostridia bacterium]
MLRQTTLKLSLGLLESAVLGVVLSTIFVIMQGGIANPTLKTVITLLTLLIFGSLVYTTAWREGNKDPNRVHYGRMKKCMAKGLIAGALASAPVIIDYILLLITSAAGRENFIFLVLFRIFNLYLLQWVNLLINHPFICAIFLLPIPLFAGLGYVMGYQQKSILIRLIYKKKK